MADVPDQLVLRRHRDLVGRERQPWTRRILLGLVALLIVLAAANLFGQRPSTSTASVPSGSLEVYAPTTLRGGVFWMARFHVRDELYEDGRINVAKLRPLGCIAGNYTEVETIFDLPTEDL